MVITDPGKAPANVPNGMYFWCSHGYELYKTGKIIKYTNTITDLPKLYDIYFLNAKTIDQRILIL